MPAAVDRAALKAAVAALGPALRKGRAVVWWGRGEGGVKADVPGGEVCSLFPAETEEEGGFVLDGRSLSRAVGALRGAGEVLLEEDPPFLKISSGFVHYALIADPAPPPPPPAPVPHLPPEGLYEAVRRAARFGDVAAASAGGKVRVAGCGKSGVFLEVLPGEIPFPFSIPAEVALTLRTGNVGRKGEDVVFSHDGGWVVAPQKDCCAQGVLERDPSTTPPQASVVVRGEDLAAVLAAARSDESDPAVVVETGGGWLWVKTRGRLLESRAGLRCREENSRFRAVTKAKSLAKALNAVKAQWVRMGIKDLPHPSLFLEDSRRTAILPTKTL